MEETQRQRGQMEDIMGHGREKKWEDRKRQSDAKRQ